MSNRYRKFRYVIAALAALSMLVPATAFGQKRITTAMVELSQYFVVLEVGQIRRDNHDGTDWKIVCFLGNKTDPKLLVKQSVETGCCYVQTCDSFADQTEYVGVDTNEL